MGDPNEQRVAIVIGELENQARHDVDRALHAVGAAPRFYSSLRHAQSSRSWRCADLTLIAQGSNRIHPFATCWQLRVSGYSSRLLLLLRPEQDGSLPPGALAGADDVTLAPANPTDIARRATTLFEKTSKWRADEKVGRLTMDWKLGRVILGDRILDLTKTESRLLSYLMYRCCLVRWNELALVVLGAIHPTPARALAPHLAALRRKLADTSDLIETVHGIGCRLCNASA